MWTGSKRLHDNQPVTLPSGTVSLLFSDIEGSTALLARLGERYRDALDGQRRLLRAAWSDHQGVEMGTEGDSFFVVFSTAADAVAAAVHAQRSLSGFDWPDRASVRVRMGIHTGSPSLHDGGYVGMDVHRAARIAGAAHGGQTLLSAATADLVADALPDGVGLRDLGRHRLKDIPQAERIHQLVIEGLRSHFPVPRTLGAVSNLPRPGTPLLGRDGELRELSALLASSEVRLVNLTGAGGTGKTRLAVALAERVAARFPDGVFFVDASATGSADGLWSGLAIAVDAPPETASPPDLFEHLGQAPLVVLDNLEQIADADIAVTALMNGASGVTVLTTSRRALLVPGEHVHPVPPLELPETGVLAEAERAGAVQLLVRQAQMAGRGFSLNESNAAEIVEICRRLDGLPLALELAAARLRLMTPKALLARWETSLDIAAPGRTGPVRQHTLRETIAWSYRLLDPAQQRLFRSLGIFAGGTDLRAVEELCGTDAVDALAGLVDASLVLVTENADGDARIGMLVTVRAFALDAARAEGEFDELAKRHALYLVRCAAERDEQLQGADPVAARAWFEAELDNLRAALSWLLALTPEKRFRDAHGVWADLALSAALTNFWVRGGPFVEGRRWLAQATERPGLEDSPELAECLISLGILFLMSGDTDRAHKTRLRAAELAARLEDDALLSRVLASLAEDASAAGDYDEALRLVGEAVLTAGRSGEPRALLSALSHAAVAAIDSGRYDEALDFTAKSAALAEELGDPVKALYERHNAAYALFAAGRPGEAAERMIASIPGFIDLAGVDLATVADDLALCLAALDQHAEAARLIGAVDADNLRQQVVRHPMQQELLTDASTLGRAAIPEEWQGCYDAGHLGTVRDAMLHVQSSAARSLTE
jgi:predicted ATPase/class 3 adenylate cyclase